LNKFIQASKANFGNKSGGGGVGAASKAPKAAMGKANGGKGGNDEPGAGEEPGGGGTVRYVTLPLEAHGYAARETTEHVLYEMINWFDKYVKNAAPRRPVAQKSEQ